jgi:hypothetical protein
MFVSSLAKAFASGCDLKTESELQHLRAASAASGPVFAPGERLAFAPDAPANAHITDI